MAGTKLFKLTWTSKDETATLDCGEYASIVDAGADTPAAKARLQAPYPATGNFRYPHDIEAGTWRVVPIELPPTIRTKPV